MSDLILDRWGTVFEETPRRPDARLYSPGELVRFLSSEERILPGTVLRVSGVKPEQNIVQLQRKSGVVLAWTPTRAVQVFSESSAEVKVGSVFEWRKDHQDHGVRAGDLARIVEVHPTRGVTVRAHKSGESVLALEPGVWHYAVDRDGVVGHLRARGEHRLEPYRDLDPVPEKASHDLAFDDLVKAFSLVTHGAPPPIDTYERGDLVYFAESRQTEIPDNHVFRVDLVDHVRGNLRLVQGRELSVNPEDAPDMTWQPRADDQVRVYKFARSIAAQDLVMWQRDDPKLLVRRGSFSEVVRVKPYNLVVTGFTSTPEVLHVDRDRWTAHFHPGNDAWRLRRGRGVERAREHVPALGLAI